MAIGRVIRGLASASAGRLIKKAIKHKKKLLSKKKTQKKKKVVKKKKPFNPKGDPVLATVRKQTLANLKQAKRLKSSIRKAKKALGG